MDEPDQFAPGNYVLARDSKVDKRRVTSGTVFWILRWEGDLALCDFGRNRQEWFNRRQLSDLTGVSAGGRLISDIEYLRARQPERVFTVRLPASCHRIISQAASGAGEFI